MFETRMGMAELAELPARLAAMPVAASDPDRVDQLRLAAALKGASAALEMRVAVELGETQIGAALERGHDLERAERSLVGQVGLARRESPATSRRWLGWARNLVRDLPNTFAALERGQVPERRATIIAQETGWLSSLDRKTVDAELADSLPDLGDRAAHGAARRIGYRLDPHGTVKRRAKAEADRRVGIRPAPDAMAWVTALLPVGQAVATYAALRTKADAARAAGDLRSRGQVMADTLVERVTGQATADAVGVQIELVMTDRALFGGDHPVDPAADEPATLREYGPIPAELARKLVHAAPDTQASIRRIYSRGGQLVALDAHHRRFTGQLRAATVLRDQYCRTPWCGAPIRHADHVVDAVQGGPTSLHNGQGLCEHCNYLKTEPGWHARPGSTEAAAGAVHEVIITTPTGHTYRSRPPPLPGDQTGAQRVDDG